MITCKDSSQLCMPILLVMAIKSILKGDLDSVLIFGSRCLIPARSYFRLCWFTPLSNDKGTISGNRVTNSSTSIKLELFGFESISHLLYLEWVRPIKRLSDYGLNWDNSALRESKIRRPSGVLWIRGASRPLTSMNTRRFLKWLARLLKWDGRLKYCS